MHEKLLARRACSIALAKSAKAIRLSAHVRVSLRLKKQVHYSLPNNFFAVEGFGQLKILAFGQIPASLS